MIGEVITVVVPPCSRDANVVKDEKADLQQNDADDENWIVASFLDTPFDAKLISDFFKVRLQLITHHWRGDNTLISTYFFARGPAHCHCSFCGLDGAHSSFWSLATSRGPPPTLLCRAASGINCVEYSGIPSERKRETRARKKNKINVTTSSSKPS